MVKKRSTAEKTMLESATNPDYAGLIEDYAEFGIEQLADNDIVDGIPVVRTIVAMGKGYVNIRDRLFLKKVAQFLKAANKITPKEREEWYVRLAKDGPEKEQEIADKIWMMIDATNNSYKAAVHGKILRAYVKGLIQQEEHFYYLMEMVDSAPTNIIRALETGRKMNPDAYYRIGIMESPVPTMSEMEEYQDRQGRLARVGMAAPAFLKNYQYTAAGNMLIKILRDYE